ncbi:Hypothetical predicted protein [Mytilus galloprovincialis]|uniref:Uncharacterized protein n=1 Tax=Mytilus galloprovincialis TaxID=29158 RepID=A0A8B6HJL5_MYTGA|nr:Hypothetical predicted protein [Mytilus galloprovincialis]
MSDQVKKLTKEGACGGNEELVGLAEEIKTNDTRYSQKHHPAVKRQLAKKAGAVQQADHVQQADAVQQAGVVQHAGAGQQADAVQQAAAPQQADAVQQAAAPQQAGAVQQAAAAQQAGVQLADIDHRQNAIIVNVDDGEEEAIPPPPKKKTSDLAREAYMHYSESIERSKKLEEKLDRCMDKFLSD